MYQFVDVPKDVMIDCPMDMKVNLNGGSNGNNPNSRTGASNTSVGLDGSSKVSILSASLDSLSEHQTVQAHQHQQPISPGGLMSGQSKLLEPGNQNSDDSSVGGAVKMDPSRSNSMAEASQSGAECGENSGDANDDNIDDKSRNNNCGSSNSNCNSVNTSDDTTDSRLDVGSSTESTAFCTGEILDRENTGGSAIEQATGSIQATDANNESQHRHQQETTTTENQLNHHQHLNLNLNLNLNHRPHHYHYHHQLNRQVQMF